MTIHRVLVEKLGATDAANFVGNAGELFFDPDTTTLRFPTELLLAVKLLVLLSKEP